MRNSFRLPFIVFLLVLLPDELWSQEHWRSSVEQVPLLELYTSEGCSSCPPADRWFTSLKADPGLWSHYVPVAFHVDYWNGLGWRDRFSRREYSQRQHRYREQGGVDVVYTPGIVLSGKEWKNFHWQPVPKVERPQVGVLEAQIGQYEVQVTFTPAQEVGDRAFVAHLGLLGGELSTPVRRGENAGRELRHDFVLLHWVQVALKRTSSPSGQPVFSGTTRRPVSDRNVPRNALAIWVADNTSQAPVQALGGWLD